MKNFFKSNLIIIIAVLVTVVIIFFAVEKSGNINTISVNSTQNINNVKIENGKQIIEITAKGGYRPEHSIAKAGISSILRIDTSGTYDCTAIIEIPSMHLTKNLPLIGTTDIDLGIQDKGTLYGTCGAGLYPFEIEFN